MDFSGDMWNVETLSLKTAKSGYFCIAFAIICMTPSDVCYGFSFSVQWDIVLNQICFENTSAYSFI